MLDLGARFEHPYWVLNSTASRFHSRAASGTLPAMPAPFDPMAWLHSKDAEAVLHPDGALELRFDQHTPQATRQRIRRVIAGYEKLLRLQLDVPPGTRPRTVYQLLASCRLRIVGNSYQFMNGAGPMSE